MVDIVFYVDEIVQVLHDHFGEAGKPLLLLLYGQNTDSDNFSKPAELEVPNCFITITITVNLFLFSTVVSIVLFL